MANAHSRSGSPGTTLLLALAGALTIPSSGTSAAATRPVAVAALSESSTGDPLMIAARMELAASNRHDLSAFLQVFTQHPAILVDAAPYSYQGKAGLAEFFRNNLLGTRVQYTIKPGAPQTEDRAGDHAYLEMIVNVRATDSKGDTFNDPIHWIAALGRHGGSWKIDVLTLTTAGD